VTFSHEGQTVTQRGLVVLAGPLRDQLRQARQRQLQALQEQLAQVRADIGQPRLGTLKALQRRVNSRLRTSPAGHLIETQVYTNPQGQIQLTWQVNTSLLAQAERRAGRYLLVTNNWCLSHAELFQLYRDKDGGEKRFLISKSDLQVSPVFLHKDERIAAMLLLNMIALLAYSLLERQMRQQGLQLTTRQLIRRLQNLTLIETRFIDGSCMRRLTPLDPACLTILPLVLTALESLIEQAVPTQPNAALPGASPPLLLPKLS
jgi:transposase